ncbi:MAG: hypothetical protein CM15mV78_160 [uncultured marine virus]|nr:MAG: hypothetical protein CM15mV78_160 [uncultured marine virus]
MLHQINKHLWQSLLHEERIKKDEQKFRKFKKKQANGGNKKLKTQKLQKKEKKRMKKTRFFSGKRKFFKKLYGVFKNSKKRKREFGKR